MQVNELMPKPRVAIYACGERTRTHHNANWNVWRVAWDSERADMYWEIHHPRLWDNENPIVREAMNYRRYLAALPNALMVIADGADIAAARDPMTTYIYPIDEILDFPGLETGYITNSLSYMLLYAKRCGAKFVDFPGLGHFERCDYQEILYERSNLAYLIGLFWDDIVFGFDRDSEFRQLNTLASLPSPNLVTSQMPRWLLEFCLGREISRRADATKFNHRGDLRTVPWSDPPRYGFKLLEECGMAPFMVARDVARELGIPYDGNPWIPPVAVIVRDSYPGQVDDAYADVPPDMRSAVDPNRGHIDISPTDSH